MSLTQFEASNQGLSCLIRLRSHRIKICISRKNPLGRAFQQLEIPLNCKVSIKPAALVMRFWFYKNKRKKRNNYEAEFSFRWRLKSAAQTPYVELLHFFY